MNKFIGWVQGRCILRGSPRNGSPCTSVLCYLLAILVLGACGPEQRAATSSPPPLELGRLLGSPASSGPAGASEPGDLGFSFAQAPAQLVFPQDHGAHPNYRSEWWYLTLILQDAQGRAYGGQFTLFRQAQNPGPLVAANPWQANHLFMAHLAASDVDGRQHLSAQRFGRSHPQLAGVEAPSSTNSFRSWLDGWTLESTGPGMLPLKLLAENNEPGADFGFSLALDSTKALVLQGDRGYSAKGPDQASYYYSYSRLSAAGNLRLGDQLIPVTGSAWLDHEWSTSVLSSGQQGWDWLAFQLADVGEEVMAFRLRRDDGKPDPFDAAVRVLADGSTLHFKPDEFSLTPTGYWQDEQGVCWPINWQLDLPDARYEVRAMLQDQRMQTAVQYWEGLVEVFEQDRAVGRGYLELTGYSATTKRCE